MAEISIIQSMNDFLDFNQIINLLKDQMDYIGSPKSNEEIMKTVHLALASETAHMLVIHEGGHPIGFVYFNIAIGMESAGKYAWINEMHVHSQYRGKGYGTELFNALKEWCVAHSVLRIMGMADDSEEDTLRFYQKQGANTYPQQIFSLYVKK